MIKPAVILTWDISTDCPVARWNLTRFKDYFNSIYIAFSDHHAGHDLSNFIRNKLPFCKFIEPKRKRDDWRDDAVNNAIDEVPDSVTHVLFLEQDFLIKDHTFFDRVLNDDKLNFLCYIEGKRIHPAFAVVKKELIDKTNRDFSATPPGDHFHQFFKELEIFTDKTNLESLGVKHKEDYFHMQGTNQNYVNFKYGEPFFAGINFLYWNWKNLQFPNQHVYFYKTEFEIESKFGHTKHHSFLDKFFPEDYEHILRLSP